MSVRMLFEASDIADLTPNRVCLSTTAQEIRTIVREELHSLKQVVDSPRSHSGPIEYTPRRVALLFDGVGVPPTLTFQELLAQRDDFSKTMLAILTNALYEAADVHPDAVPKKACKPSTWDLYLPAVQLSMCLVQHCVDLFYTPTSAAL